MAGNSRLIVALDVDDLERAEKLIDRLSDQVEIFKVGITPFTAFGDILLEKLKAAGKKVFLDLKFHDIPNTVASAAKIALEKDIFMMNFHCLGGSSMLRAAVDAVREGCERTGKRKPLLIGVTLLTSMSKEDMCSAGLEGDPEEKVLELARLARDTGLDGVVASAREAELIKNNIGKDFVVVTPGVRPEWAASGDQKRVLTPREAVSRGADYIVVGRPIIQAEDPGEAAGRIIDEMKG